MQMDAFSIKENDSGDLVVLTQESDITLTWNNLSDLSASKPSFPITEIPLIPTQHLVTSFPAALPKKTPVLVPDLFVSPYFTSR